MRPMKVILATIRTAGYGLFPTVLLELPTAPEAEVQAAKALGLKRLDRGSFQIIGTAPDELATLWQYVPFDALDFNELNQLASQLARFTDAQWEDFLSLLAQRRQDEEKSMEETLSIARECAGPEGPTLEPGL